MSDRPLLNLVNPTPRIFRRRVPRVSEESDPEWAKAFHEHVWPLYRPVRHDAKYAAFCVWMLLTPHTNELFNEIVDALEKQIPEFRSRKVEHRPHLRTWLNQRRWEDG